MAILKPIFGNALVFIDGQNCQRCTQKEYYAPTLKSDWVYQQLKQEPCGNNLTDCAWYDEEIVIVDQNFNTIPDGDLPSGWTQDVPTVSVQDEQLVFETDDEGTPFTTLLTGITLTAGKRYRVEFYYKVNVGGFQIMENGATVSIFDTDVAENFEGNFNAIYTAEGTGQIIMATYAIADALPINTIFDDFKITEITSCYTQCTGVEIACPPSNNSTVRFLDDFVDNTNGWTLGGVASISGGNLNLGNSGSASLNPVYDFVDGMQYQLVLTFEDGGLPDPLDIQISGYNIQIDTYYVYITSGGAKQRIVTFTASATNEIILFAGAANDIHIKQIYIREICENVVLTGDHLAIINTGEVIKTDVDSGTVEMTFTDVVIGEPIVVRIKFGTIPAGFVDINLFGQGLPGISDANEHVYTLLGTSVTTNVITVDCTGTDPFYISKLGVDNCGDLWSIVGNGTICSGPVPGRFYYDGTPIVAGYYKVQIEIVDYVSGSLQIKVGDGLSTAISGNGIHTVYVTSGTTGTVTIIPTIDFVGCLSDKMYTYKMEAKGDFEVSLLNADGTPIADLASYVTTKDDFVTLKFRFSDLPLSDQDLGCYKVKWHEQCEEVQNFSISCAEEGDNGFQFIYGTNDQATCNGGLYTWSKAESNPDPQGSIEVVKMDGDIILRKGVTYKIKLTDFQTLAGEASIGYDFGGDSGTFDDSNDAAHDIELTITPTEDTDRLFFTFSAISYETIDFSICYIQWDSIVISVAAIDNDYITNGLKFVLDDAIDCSRLMKITAYSDTNNAGFNFVDADFILTQRIDCLIGRTKYKEEAVIPIDSAGNGSTVFASSQKWNQLMINRVPEYVHDFMSIAKRLQHFLIEETEYITEVGEYEPEWPDEANSLPAPARFNITKAEKGTTYNYNC